MKMHSQPKRQPPPNYASRRVQVRLLVAVGSLMCVLVLMVEARKPENWEWMWLGVRNEEVGGSENGEVNTRLPPKPRNELPPGYVFVEPVEAWEDQPTAASAGDPGAPEAAPSGLQEERLSVPASDDAKGDDSKGTADPDAENREADSASRPAAESPRSQALLARDNVLDRAQLDSIRDDAVWRPDERDAWFKLVGILQQADSASQQKQAAERVGFVQLFDQPDVYRGRLVTVRGTVRQAYRVQAPRNEWGVEGYYVFWLRPAGGPNSPIVVYALELPRGFPELPDKDLDGKTLPLEEDVEFHGFFFKRWAYRARGGLHTAPMLLAKVADWTPSATSQQTTRQASFGIVAAALAGTSVLAVLVAVLVYRTSRPGRRRSVTGSGAAQQESFEMLRHAKPTPRPEEHLRNLAHDARNKR